MTQPLQEFLISLRQSLKENSFVKLSLSNYKGEEVDLQKIDIRKILIKREEKLSFTHHYKTRDIVKNYGFDESISLVAKFLAEGFRATTLFTTAFDLRLDVQKQMLHKNKASSSAPASLDHNRQKNRLITAEKPYLHELNITDDAGNVFKNAQDKFRQINKYVEILSGLIKHLPPEKLEKVVDMGAGKGYLTFALYDYMTNTMGLKTQITGIEYRQDMVDLCNKTAQKSRFNSLKFEQGTIEKSDISGANILIALHACDTATDEAIYKGITASADLIVVAPCCHKQIRQQIEFHKAHNELDFLLKHGIFVERQSEMVTDGLRAMILEYFGYSTKVFEFIEGEHTPKNVMIVGTKTQTTRNVAILEKIKATKAYFRIDYHHLEKLLGIDK
jgi:tRNA1(Val) A37 N6-methylase TrmN6